MSMPKVEVKKCQSDPRLIKNTFICGSARGIRLGLDKDPRRFKGDTQYIHPILMENGNTLLHNEIDDKLSFVIGTGEMAYNESMSNIDKYDYEVPAEYLNKVCKYKNHQEGLPLSFLQIKTEDEGIEWYAKHHPKIPTDLLPIIARYHWGEPITKKGIKNEKKKIEKEMQKQGLQVINKKVSLKFD
jgi:hypothetical protein